MAELHLDLEPGLARHTAIERALRAAIRDGRLRPGDPLPSTRGLAVRLGVARGTVVEAYAQLSAEGWFHSRQGAATVVAAAPAHDPPAEHAVPPRGPRWDFRPGEPDTSLFPGPAWLAALRTVLRGVPADAFRYGDQRGRPELRAALSGYLARARKVVCPPERIVVVSGFSPGLRLLCGVFAELGITGLNMEDPCLYRHRDVVRRTGLAIHPVPVDEEGIEVGALAARATLVTPAHQYPLGHTLSPLRRKQIVDWAREVDGYVVEDDYDGEYRYDRQPVGALHELDPTRVVYGGTTSKLLAPGMRMGWLALPAKLVDPVLDTMITQNVPALDQLAMAELITSGRFDAHIRRTRTAYRRRREHLVSTLADLPLGGGLTGISAGLHALLELPEGLALERELVAAGEREGIALEGLEPYWHSEPGRAGLVLAYSRVPAAQVRQSVTALEKLLRRSGDARRAG
ncbi:GntR family transcriptional regulator/MocR family aminotransferase [Crossiella equi]|uniref:GntR family transcriptional regulator/MocR family aminotransferase n=1 Tax=Crossiella equi TaxID=130796 RepID=A0ABS5AD28_9PSEU|nr:PLP-dependent aminotransferase family protein [Crossiella equi]MBP2474488.1 GntR family transcriptional regulator/MocR family aminotransferase [Crossiella equi]